MPALPGRHALRPPARHRAPRSRPSALAVLAVLAVGLSGTAVLGLGVVVATAIIGQPETNPKTTAGEVQRVQPDAVAGSPTAPEIPAVGEVPPRTKGRDSERSPARRQAVKIPERATGQFAVAPAAVAAEPAPGTTYEVVVEVGLPIAVRTFARATDRALQAPRGWTATGRHTLARTDRDADIRIVLASPETADLLCAPLDTGGRLSCRNGRDVVINAWRWANGARSYASDLTGYRIYVINHEVGHSLGYAHAACPAAGELAPVMVQQTKGLDGCRANPWPALVDLDKRH